MRATSSRVSNGAMAHPGQAMRCRRNTCTACGFCPRWASTISFGLTRAIPVARVPGNSRSVFDGAQTVVLACRERHHRCVSADVLGRCAVFEGLSPAELDRLLAEARRQTLERGQVLFSQGDPATHCYVLESGRMRLVQLHLDGRAVIHRILAPGEFFGGIATLGDEVYPLSAEAVEGSAVLAWSGEAMHRILLVHPRVAVNLLRMQARRIRELQERVNELAWMRVEQRLARAVLRLARQAGRRTQEGILLELSLSREDLANLTGTTLYTASRILSHWEQRGIVRAGRQRLVIRVPHALVEVAEDLSLIPDKEQPGGGP